MLLSGFYCAHFIEIRGNGNSYRFKKTIAPLLLFHLQNAKNAQRKIRYEPEIALGVIVFVCYIEDVVDNLSEELEKIFSDLKKEKQSFEAMDITYEEKAF